MISPASAPDVVDNEATPVAERLIRSAIELYGHRGTQAVSTREIQRHAAVLNEAAVRYYFGGKTGLLDACLGRVASAYGVIADEAWAVLTEKRKLNECDVEDVVTALVVTFHLLREQDPAAVQFVARMIREEGETGQDLLLKHFGTLIWRLERDLAALLPHKSATALRFHVFLAINSTVNGMVDQGLLWRLPSTARSSASFSLSATQLTRGFVAYVAAGLRSDIPW